VLGFAEAPDGSEPIKYLAFEMEHFLEQRRLRNQNLAVRETYSMADRKMLVVLCSNQLNGFMQQFQWLMKEHWSNHDHVICLELNAQAAQHEHDLLENALQMLHTKTKTAFPNVSNVLVNLVFYAQEDGFAQRIANIESTITEVFFDSGIMHSYDLEISIYSILENLKTELSPRESSAMNSYLEQLSDYQAQTHCFERLSSFIVGSTGNDNDHSTEEDVFRAIGFSILAQNTLSRVPGFRMPTSQPSLAHTALGYREISVREIDIYKTGLAVMLDGCLRYLHSFQITSPLSSKDWILEVQQDTDTFGSVMKETQTRLGAQAHLLICDEQRIAALQPGNESFAALDACFYGMIESYLTVNLPQHEIASYDQFCQLEDICNGSTIELQMNWLRDEEIRIQQAKQHWLEKDQAQSTIPITDIATICKNREILVKRLLDYIGEKKKIQYRLQLYDLMLARAQKAKCIAENCETSLAKLKNLITEVKSTTQAFESPRYRIQAEQLFDEIVKPKLIRRELRLTLEDFVGCLRAILNYFHQDIASTILDMHRDFFRSLREENAASIENIVAQQIQGVCPMIRLLPSFPLHENQAFVVLANDFNAPEAKKLLLALKDNNVEYAINLGGSALLTFLSLTSNVTSDDIRTITLYRSRKGKANGKKAE